MQKYLFKVGPIDLPDGPLLPGIVDFFEEGSAAGKGVLEVIDTDVAAFCDDLVKDSRTCADVHQESIGGESGVAEKEPPSVASCPWGVARTRGASPRRSASSPPADIIGLPLANSAVRSRFGVTVVAIKRPGEGFTYATPETVVEADDTIIVAGRTRATERFSELQ